MRLGFSLLATWVDEVGFGRRLICGPDCTRANHVSCQRGLPSSACHHQNYRLAYHFSLVCRFYLDLWTDDSILIHTCM